MSQSTFGTWPTGQARMYAQALLSPNLGPDVVATPGWFLPATVNAQDFVLPFDVAALAALPLQPFTIEAYLYGLGGAPSQPIGALTVGTDAGFTQVEVAASAPFGGTDIVVVRIFAIGAFEVVTP